MTSNTPYNGKQPHIKLAVRGFSPGLQDLLAPDIFYLTTWTFNLEKLLRQGRGFGGAALFPLISLKKAISGQMFLPPLFLFSDGQLQSRFRTGLRAGRHLCQQFQSTGLLSTGTSELIRQCSVCWYRCTGQIAVGEPPLDVSC